MRFPLPAKSGFTLRPGTARLRPEPGAACAFAAALFLLSALPVRGEGPVANTDAGTGLRVAGVAAAMGQSGFGALDPAPPTDVTPEQIIQKFAAREAEFSKARDSYTFRQTVKVDTINDDNNKVDGEYQQVTEISFDDSGRRNEHVVFALQNTLERV